MYLNIISISFGLVGVWIVMAGYADGSSSFEGKGLAFHFCQLRSDA